MAVKPSYVSVAVPLSDLSLGLMQPIEIVLRSADPACTGQIVLLDGLTARPLAGVRAVSDFGPLSGVSGSDGSLPLTPFCGIGPRVRLQKHGYVDAVCEVPPGGQTVFAKLYMERQLRIVISQPKNNASRSHITGVFSGARDSVVERFSKPLPAPQESIVCTLPDVDGTLSLMVRTEAGLGVSVEQELLRGTRELVVDLGATPEFLEVEAGGASALVHYVDQETLPVRSDAQGVCHIPMPSQVQSIVLTRAGSCTVELIPSEEGHVRAGRLALALEPDTASMLMVEDESGSPLADMDVMLSYVPERAVPSGRLGLIGYIQTAHPGWLRRIQATTVHSSDTRGRVRLRGIREGLYRAMLRPRWETSWRPGSSMLFYLPQEMVISDGQTLALRAPRPLLRRILGFSVVGEAPLPQITMRDLVDPDRPAAEFVGYVGEIWIKTTGGRIEVSCPGFKAKEIDASRGIEHKVFLDPD